MSDTPDTSIIGRLMDSARRFYGRLCLSPGPQRHALSRLEHGLREYGPENHLNYSTAEYRREVAEELGDACNLLDPLHISRFGEPSWAAPFAGLVLKHYVADTPAMFALETRHELNRLLEQLTGQEDPETLRRGRREVGAAAYRLWAYMIESASKEEGAYHRCLVAADGRPMTQAGMARALGRDQSWVCRMTAELTKCGQVERAEIGGKVYWRVLREGAQ